MGQMPLAMFANRSLIGSLFYPALAVGFSVGLISEA